MKKILLLIVLLFIIISCDRIHGWFPGYTDPQLTTTNPQGCINDVNIHYKNNCSEDLIVYFIEIVPGSTFNCENLANLGIIGRNQTKTFVIHKGKIGYFAFAQGSEGQCSNAHRKVEYWVNCDNSNGNDGYFDICH